MGRTLLSGTLTSPCQRQRAHSWGIRQVRGRTRAPQSTTTQHSSASLPVLLVVSRVWLCVWCVWCVPCSVEPWGGLRVSIFYQEHEQWLLCSLQHGPGLQCGGTNPRYSCSQLNRVALLSLILLHHCVFLYACVHTIARFWSKLSGAQIPSDQGPNIILGPQPWAYHLH